MKLAAAMAVLATLLGWSWCHYPQIIHYALKNHRDDLCRFASPATVDWAISTCRDRVAVWRYEVFVEESAAKRKPAWPHNRFASLP